MSVLLGKEHTPSPGSLKTHRKTDKTLKQIEQKLIKTKAFVLLFCLFNADFVFQKKDSRQRASRACVSYRHQLCDPVGQRHPALWSLMYSLQKEALHPGVKTVNMPSHQMVLL